MDEDDTAAGTGGVTAAAAAALRGADAFGLKVSGKSFHPSICSLLFFGMDDAPGGGGAGVTPDGFNAAGVATGEAAL